jgi:hypothetical protein
MSHPRILDERGNVLTIGSAVNTSAELPPYPPHLINHRPAPNGVITAITDLDYDADEDGHSIVIHPIVHVQWPECHDTETFSTWPAHGYATWDCEDDVEWEVNDLILIPRQHNHERPNQ